MTNIIIKEIDGFTRVINKQNIISAFFDDNIIIAGMDIHTILEMRYQYFKKGGKLPITSDSVKEIFNHETQP